MTIAIGQEAPDFELPNQFGEKVSLSYFRGKKNVVVVFFPFAFTGTCTGELCALRDDLSVFQNDNVELLAISCDAMFTQKVFAEKEGITSHYSLISGLMERSLKSMEFLTQSAALHYAEHLSSIRAESCVGAS